MHRLQTENQRLNKTPSIHTPPQTQNANQIIRLNNTLFSKENAIRFTAGTRPYREAGIRMEKQLLDGKTIYHNYGHGGGGLSVGYGCVSQVVQNLFEANRISSNQSVAVLGAGIIGLTTAYLLSLKGIKVNLYADIYPFVHEQGKPELTTTVAAGYWMPLKLGNKEQTKKVAKLTWDHYHELMAIQRQTGQNLGVTKLPTYCVNDDEGLTYFQIEGVIHPKKVQVCFENGVPFQAVTFPSLIIESTKYLPYLIQKMKESGKVKFHKEVVTRQSLNEKAQKYIFNCCGLNGADFYGDTSKNKGIKGHVWHFDLSKQKQVADYILFLKTKQGRWILQVPHLHSNKLVLGISYEDGKKDSLPEVDQATKIIQNAQNFYKTVVLTNKGKETGSL